MICFRSLFYRACLFGLLGLLAPSSAISQASFISNVRIEVDTSKKIILFRYDLHSFSVGDSIYVEILKSDGESFRLQTVSGQIGSNLAIGRDKVFIWNPLADGKKIDEDVEIRFARKTLAANVGFATRRKIFTKENIRLYLPWLASISIATVTTIKGLTFVRDRKEYINHLPPINVAEKIEMDNLRNTLIDQRKNVLSLIYISAATVLVNSSYHFFVARSLRNNISIIFDATKVQISYNF